METEVEVTVEAVVEAAVLSAEVVLKLEDSSSRFKPFLLWTRTVTEGAPQSNVENSSEWSISKSDSGKEMSSVTTMVPGRQLSAEAAAKECGLSTRVPSTNTTSACLSS